MPIPTVFHPRTSRLCTSLRWKEWSGHFAVCSYDTCHEREYHAIRQSAGLIDVSPLFKYEVHGADAAAFLARLMVRDIRKLKVGRVTYLCWCDDDGKVIDDGTVARIDGERYRVTANHPARAWMSSHLRNERVAIDDVSQSLAALAIQGPTSRSILEDACDADLAKMRFFRVGARRLAGVDVEVSRTGYTGDLGYEVWVPCDEALKVWDALMAAGSRHRLQPAGLDAMDVTRIEAGFILNGVDYFSAHHCLIESRKSTPDEISLGWTVDLEREPFVGQRALRDERSRGPAWRLVGLDYDWDDLESLFAEFGLPPSVPAQAWRDGVPVYAGGDRQIGQATSGAWSPLLKKKLALASIDPAYAEPGRELEVEVTVEYQRRRVGARIAKTPFFDPQRKRA